MRFMTDFQANDENLAAIAWLLAAASKLMMLDPAQES